MAEKAKVPLEVAQAFDCLKRSWIKFDKDTINLMLLNVGTVAQVDDLLILKEFSLKNPTTYIQALANGYEPIEIPLEEQVSKMVNHWINTPFIADNEEEDVKVFSKVLTDFFRKELVKQ